MSTAWDRMQPQLAAMAGSRVLEPPELARLARRLRERFVANPSAVWWWSSLRVAPQIVEYLSDGLSELEASLTDLRPRDDLVLVVTDDEPEPLGAVAGPWRELRSILEEQTAFEFILTNLEARWAIFDTHHNRLYVVRWQQP